jgi:hypothetical protein
MDGKNNFIKKAQKNFCSIFAPVLLSRSRGAGIKLPPGAGITNCGTGSGFFQEIFIEKIMVAEEVFVNC